MHRLIIIASTAMPALASDITQVDPASLTTTDLDDFNDLGSETTNDDDLLSRPGFALAERFVGQAQEADGVWDVITALPSAPLTLQPGDPSENLATFEAPEPWLLTVVAGNGPAGFPNFNAIGEGALSILFESDQSEFGIELEGVEFGCITFDFFRRDGSPIDSETICGAQAQPYAFRRVGNVTDIAGVVMTNTDPSGLAFDNVRFSMNPCFADMNEDGELNILDFVAFQSAYAAGDMAADCDADGALTVLDFVCFQNAFMLGCA